MSGAKVQPITTDNTNEWKRKTRPPCAEFRKTLTANLSETGTTTTNGVLHGVARLVDAMWRFFDKSDN